MDRFEDVTPALCEALEGRTIVEVRRGPTDISPWLVIELDNGDVVDLLDGWGNCPLIYFNEESDDECS